MSLINQKIMNYRITTKIGEGGMGSVYLGIHETLQIKVAIKVLHAAFSADEQLRKRFINEAKTLSNINHPNIVKVLDFYDGHEGLFIIMEYVPGIPLDELIKTKTGPIPEERAFKIFAKILDGFQYAHSRKPAIIHRDIKPSNIIIDENDEPKIIDFGIVKIVDADKTDSGRTMAGTKIGTAFFMSPEQILAKAVDARSDIFSLGITLFIMLTGRSPFGSTLSEYEVHNTIVTSPLPRAKELYPGVSDVAQSIIDKATEKQKENRFQNCNEFKAALQNGQEIPTINKKVKDPVSEVPPYMPYELVHPQKKSNPGMITAVAVVVIGLIGMSVYIANAKEEKIKETVVIKDTSLVVTRDTTTVVTSDVINHPMPSTTTIDTMVSTNVVTTPTTTNNDISYSDISSLTSIMKKFYEEDNRDANDFEIDRTLSFFSFPLERYYQLAPASRDEVYESYRSSIYDKLLHHNQTINWNNSYFEKDGNNYKGHISGTYEFSTNASPTEVKTRNINDVFIFNEYGKIISVYQ